MTEHALTVRATALVDTATDSQPNRVDAPHAAYARMAERYTLTRALRAGTDEVRRLRDAVLPQLEGESDEGYEIRLKLAALHPGFEKAVEVAVGLLMQTEPTLDKDNAPELLAFWEDVDGSDTHGALYCDHILTDGITDGIVGTFTDYTRADDPTLDRSAVSAAATTDASELDAADTAALGLRPYWVRVRADEIIRELYQTVRGMKQLVLFIRKETSEELVEPFGVRTVTRHRAYRLRGKVVTCEVFEQREGEAEPVSTGAPVVLKGITRIPWAPLPCGAIVSATETRPPLMGLAYLVIQYHQIATNMLSLGSLAMVPSLIRIGAQPDANGNYPPIVIGPRKSIEAPYVEGVTKPIYWESPDVSVLEPSDQSLTRTETLMGLASASFLAPEKRAAETEKSKQMAQRAGHATLSRVGRRLQDMLELALQDVAAFLSVKAGSVTVNLDFEDALMESDVMMAYVKLVEAGFPKSLALEALQIGGRIKPDTDLVAAIAAWDLELDMRAADRAEEAAAQQEALTAQNGQPPADGVVLEEAA